MAKHAKIRELSPKQSYAKVKNLLKEKKRLTKKDMIPGNLIFTHYDAKYKENTYDRTPLVLILRRNPTHTLGLNFHWLLMNMRMDLVLHIMKLNKRNIQDGLPLQFSYDKMKPLLKKFGYAPCIRLYINKRFAKSGIKIPPSRLMEITMLKTETFTAGRYSAPQLFKMALSSGKKRAKNKINARRRERYKTTKDTVNARRRERYTQTKDSYNAKRRARYVNRKSKRQ